MPGPEKFGQFVITYLSVTGSTIDGPHNAVLVGGTTGVGSATDDSKAETAQDSEAYGAPGIVFRPRPPEKIGDETIGAESMAFRAPDGAIPLAWRDLRFNRVYANPKAGSVALVGYGGGFHSLEDTTAGYNGKKATTHVLYAPYAFDGNGTPQKAHAVIIDTEPGSECVSIVHGEGQSIVLTKEKQIMLSIDANTWAQMKAGQFNVQADQIALIGTVMVGHPTTSVALLGGAASQPSTRLRITTP